MDMKFPKTLAQYGKLLAWLMTLTILFGTMYGLVQQQNRLTANDMPTMLATEAARLINGGLDASTVGNSSPQDISTTRVPFIIVYDKKGKSVGGSGYLDKKLAQIPLGVLQHATAIKPNAVTWQPKSGVRLATVTVATKNNYVVGAQSLKATEDRDSTLLKLTALGYGLSLAVMVGYYVLRRYA